MRLAADIEESRRIFEALKGCSESERIEHLRNLYRGDLYALLRYGCNRPDMEHPWLFARCRQVQAEPNGCLDLWAREFYKTSIITVGLTLWDILNNPEVTIGIISHTRSAAEGPLRQLKREMEANEHLKAVFPDILYENPAKQSPKWSEQDGLIVRRETNPREATVEAWGLDAQPIGKHWRVVVYDDIVTGLTVNTPDMIQKTTENWRLSRNLGTVGGATRMVGTRYAFGDTWDAIIKSGTVKVRSHPATLDGEENFEADNCPFMVPEELIKRRKEQGPWVFSCQMLLKPQGDTSQGFRRDWVRYMEGQPHAAGLNVYITVDPAHSKKRSSDYTVMACIGVGGDGTYRLLDILRDRLNLTERAQALFDLVKKWSPLRVGYERYGLQADVEHIKREQHLSNVDFRIVELGGSMSKVDRIRRLIPLFEQGKFILPRTRWRTLSDKTSVDLIDALVEGELMAFPVSGHDDMMDAISRILDEDLRVKLPVSDAARQVRHRDRPQYATCGYSDQKQRLRQAGGRIDDRR
jgi:phage terminase large subunit-like protein